MYGFKPGNRVLVGVRFLPLFRKIWGEEFRERSFRKLTSKVVWWEWSRGSLEQSVVYLILGGLLYSIISPVTVHGTALMKVFEGNEGKTFAEKKEISLQKTDLRKIII